MGRPGTKTLQLQRETGFVGPDTQELLQSGHSCPYPPPSSGPPMVPSHSLVEVLLGSDLFLSVFQKDGECVVCCCLSCRETREERQGCPYPLPTPAVFKEKRSEGGAKHRGGPCRREMLHLPAKISPILLLCPSSSL